MSIFGSLNNNSFDDFSLSFVKLVESFKPIKQQIVICLLDISGSTGNQYSISKTVLQKEKEHLMNIHNSLPSNTQLIILAYTDNTIELVDINVQPGITSYLLNMQLELIRPSNSTDTKKAYTFAFDKLKSLNLANRLVRVINITDGEPNTTDGLNNVISQLKNIPNANIEVEINAVLSRSVASRLNFNNTTETKSLAGVKEVEAIGNLCSKVLMFLYSDANSNSYDDQPYLAYSSTEVSNNSRTLLGTNVVYLLKHYSMNITNLIDELFDNLALIQSEADHNKFAKFLIELGVLISPLYSSNPFYSGSLAIRLNDLNLKPSNMNIDHMQKIIDLGMSYAQSKRPISNINLSQTISQHNRRLAFAEAQVWLNSNGFVGRSNDLLLWSASKSIFIIKSKEDLDLINYKTFPKSSTSIGNSSDQFICLPIDNLDSQEQELRQMFRSIIKHEFKFEESKEDCIFFWTNYICMLVANGIDIDSELIKLLRSYARIQCSKTIMVGPNTQSSNGVLQFWINGSTPNINFNKPTKHMDLFVNPQINSFGLDQLLWWAITCAILGEDVYNGQKDLFVADPNTDSYNSTLNYIKSLDNKLIGKASFVNAIRPRSIISLEYYGDHESLVRLVDHNLCKTKTVFELSESRSINRCPWCRSSNIQFETMPNLTIDTSLSEALNNSEQLKSTVSPSILPNLNLNLNLNQTNLNQTNTTNSAQPRVICPVGNIGSGKTTITKFILEVLKESHSDLIIIRTSDLNQTSNITKLMATTQPVVFVASTDDDIDKSQDFGSEIKRVIANITRFLQIYSNKLRYILMDVVNDVKSKTFFGYKSQNPIYVLCNSTKSVDKMSLAEAKDYVGFCLYNLTRKTHSDKGVCLDISSHSSIKMIFDISKRKANCLSNKQAKNYLEAIKYFESFGGDLASEITSSYANWSNKLSTKETIKASLGEL